MIGELVKLSRGVLTLDSATFAAHVASRDALKRGLLFIVVVALLAGLFPLFWGIANSFRVVDVAQMQRDFEQRMEQQMQFNPAWQNPEFQQMFKDSFSQVFGMVGDIVQLPPNVNFLPRWLGRLLQVFAGWLSMPLAWLGAWAWYALWVMLFAKLLGGRATLARMLGATSLSVVPHVLDVPYNLLSLLSGVQVAGTCFGLLNILIALVAWGWSIAIYVKATATVNEFSLGKATFATILPALLGLLLVAVLAVVAVIAIILAAGGSR